MVVADPEAIAVLIEAAAPAPAGDQPEADVLAQGRDGEVVRDRERLEHPLRLPVPRDVGDPLPDRVPQRRQRRVAIRQMADDLAAVGPVQARQHA